MKKLLLLSILLLASTSTLTFAQEVTTGDTETTTPDVVTTSEVQANQEQIRENWKEFHENFGHAGLYINKGLTTDQKMSAKLVITTRIQNMETMNLEIRTALKNNETIDREAYKTKITEIYEGFKTDFTPFIDDAKLEAFEKFISERISMISTNRGLRAENREMKKEIKEAKKNEKEMKKIEKKEQIMQRKAVKVGARAEKLRGIIGKINNGFLTSLVGQLDHLADKAKTEESKEMMLDIKLLIQDKLGLLELDEDGNVLEETDSDETISDDEDEDETDEEKIE